jgi:hypothetical protein
MHSNRKSNIAASEHRHAILDRSKAGNSIRIYIIEAFFIYKSLIGQKFNAYHKPKFCNINSVPFRKKKRKHD